ncbi:MAG: MBOAT family O-acyltransferase [Deltaproteobacteria bacterium]|nr:MBOAT family O-acyltransferase [Deltaproteobacteria bacterium]
MVFSSPVFLFLFLPACLAAAFLAAALDRWLAHRKHQRAARALHALETIEAPVSPDAPIEEAPTTTTTTTTTTSLPPDPASAPFPHPLQNIALLTFSVIFYIYGSGWHFLIMLGSVLTSWLAAIVMGVVARRGVVLAIAVALQLGWLAYFKYANFVVDQVGTIGKALGLGKIAWAPVLLPIGISFFIFQSVSYVIDVYRRETLARRNFFDLALYIMLFPQLIAGPIVRYVHVAAEIDLRHARVHDVAHGATRFIFGLFKKLVLADSVALLADAAFALPPGEMTSSAAFLGAIAYTFQIYFDFSAYSDMGIGLGRMFGFRFPENFNRPLAATSITDFWRRWHMTLSSCFRDYVFVPLGGSRGSAFQTYRNLWLVFLLSGLWHGASWTFVAWGAFHGALLTIERIAGVKPDRGPTWRRVLTFALVVIGFTLFRAETFAQATHFYRHMLLPLDWSVPVTLLEVLTHKNLLALSAAIATLFLPLSFVSGRFLVDGNGAAAQVARFIVMTVFAVYAGGIVASSNFSPFIYFRF